MEGLTVTDERQAGRPGSRLQLGLVIAAFLGPILAAVLLYANADGWLGREASGHHGSLFQPAKPLEALPLVRTDGTPMALADLRGKWTVVVIGAGECGQTCRDALYKVRQAHKAQGKNIGRVQRLFVAFGSPPDDRGRGYLASEHPNLMVAAPEKARTSLTAFRHPDANGPKGIYVVDPNTNLVLRYDLTAGAEGIIEDLEFLLKHSTIG